MDRRSTRLKNRPQKSFSNQDETASESEQDTAIHTATKGRGRKRKATQGAGGKATNQLTAKKLKVGGGLLQAFTEMPVDVFFEICIQLDPVDLLHLARTTKSLRSILMSRSSISVWRQAFQSITDLPPCPDDMTEPQYAELVFGKSCDFCSRNLQSQYTVWSVRLRACKRCLETRFRAVSENWYDFTQGRSYPAELAEFLPNIDLPRYGKNRKYYDEETDFEWCKEYKACRTTAEKAVWLQIMLAEQKIVAAHSNGCKKWTCLQQRKRAEQHDVAVQERKIIILERLKKMGWEEELSKIPQSIRDTIPTNLPEVVKACQKELTDQVLDDLDEFLNEHMERVKGNRLIREKKVFFKKVMEKLRNTYKEYVDTQPANVFFPNTAEIFFHPVVKDAISGVESSEALEEALHIVKPLFSEIVDDCLQAIRQELTDCVTQVYTQTNHAFRPETVMDLATTLFSCRVCRHFLTLDQAVAHSCRTYTYGKEFVGLEAAVKEAIGELPWKTSKSISFVSDRLGPISRVLQNCGFDPDTTTVKDMEKVDPVIECLACSNINEGRLTMRWSGVGFHFNVTHPTDIFLLEEKEAEKVRSQMLEREQKAFVHSNSNVCTHCRMRGGSMLLLQHVKREHQIVVPVYGQDVIVAPGVAPDRPTLFLWPPRI